MCALKHCVRDVINNKGRAGHKHLLACPRQEDFQSGQMDFVLHLPTWQVAKIGENITFLSFSKKFFNVV